MDLAGAEKAIKRGAGAGFVAGALTLIVVTVAMATDAEGVLALWNDPWNIFDIALIFALSFGVLRRSRTAAICLTIYYVAAKVLIYIEVGQISGAGVAILFLYFFAKAVHGTVAYHRIRRNEDPNYRPAPKWVYYLSIPGGALALLVVGLMIVVSLGPSTAVLTGDDLRAREISALHREGILRDNEVVSAFYSAGLWSILEDGNVITNERVISYETTDNELWIASARYDQIADVTVLEKGGIISDTLISIETTDGESFYVVASTENDGDELFLDMLRDRMQADGD